MKNVHRISTKQHGGMRSGVSGSKNSTNSTSCDNEVCTHGTLWRQHYVTTSKEYSTNSHNLL